MKRLNRNYTEVKENPFFRYLFYFFKNNDLFYISYEYGLYNLFLDGYDDIVENKNHNLLYINNEKVEFLF